MKYLYTILLVGLLSLSGCRSHNGAKEDITQTAKAVESNAAQIKQDAARGLVSLEATHNALEQSKAHLTSPAPSAEDAIASIDAAQGHRAEAAESFHAIHATAGTVGKDAQRVQSKATRVENKTTFLDSLGFYIKLLVFSIVSVLVLAVGWRFGLDRIVKSIAGTIAGWIEYFGDRIHRKLDGPTKLLIEGKTDEAIAALRQAVPALDKKIKYTKKNKETQ